MKIKLTIAFLFLLVASTSIAQNYKIDAGHSLVQIQVERFGVVDVSGRFKAVEGNIQYDAENPQGTNASAIIKVDSYDANNKGGEDAVKSPAFLDAAKYPEISFTGISTQVKDGKNYLKGNLTIHGETQMIELPYTIKGPALDLPTQKQSIAFNAAITINRQDYGLTFDRRWTNGVSLVSNDVKINLLILAIAE
ncbi:MAG: YceI family protein [Bacteroidota bacterium]